MSKHLWIVACAVFTGLAGSSVPARADEIPKALRKYTLAIGPDGGAYYRSSYNPAPDASPSDPSALSGALGSACVVRGKNRDQGVRLERNVQEVMAGLSDYARERKARRQPIRIKLFLHGGLVSMSQAMKEAESVLEQIDVEGGGFYPIFVNWETGILKSYASYLFSVRRGRARPVVAPLTSPFVIVADLFRSVGRAPGFLFDQFVTLGRRIQRRYRPLVGRLVGQDGERPAEAPAGWRPSVYFAPSEPPPEWDLSIPSLYESSLDFGKELIPGALRLVSTPTLDFIGQGAFDNMRRRTHLLFLLDGDFENGGRRQECGAVSRLMNEIRGLEYRLRGRPTPTIPREEWSRNRGDDALTQLRAVHHRYVSLGEETDDNAMGLRDRRARLVKTVDNELLLIRIEIVAHSMGAIVANEILRRHGDLYFENVAYLGAASSIKDFVALALPYLQANPTTHFYNVSLHPDLERDEENAELIVPRGSLLNWLDRYIVKSRSTLDHTLGSWENIVKALPLIDYLEEEERARFHVVRLGRSARQPAKHGELNDPPICGSGESDGCVGARFWEEGYWSGRDFGVADVATPPERAEESR